MKVRRLFPAAIASIALLATSFALLLSACADDDPQEAGLSPSPTERAVTVGDLRISGVSARGALNRGAVYFTITNTGSEDDALVRASSDAARSVELHETVVQGASSMMRPVEQIEAPAGAQTALKPGGLHVMLIDTTEELAVGDAIGVTLEFERAGRVEIEAPVTSYNASPTGMPGGSSPMMPGSPTPMH